MADNVATSHLNELWEVVREQTADISALKQVISSVVSKVDSQGSKLDEVLQAVTRQTARQSPTVAQIAGTAFAIIGVVAGVAGGVSIYVASIYGGTITSLEQKAQRAEYALEQRNTEDRAELSRLREAERLTFADRLRRLEETSSWRASTNPTQHTN